jgi:cell division protein FtsW
VLTRARTWLAERRRAGSGDAADLGQYVGGGALTLAGLSSGSVAARAHEPVRRFDQALVAVVLTLVLLGIVMVYSASITLADAPRFKVGPTHFLWRHVLSIVVAFGAALIAFSLPLAVWQRLAPWLFIGGLLLLALVLIPGVGRGVNGARRWIPLGFFNLQPSELMKLACVLYAADFTVRKQDWMHSLRRGFLPLAGAMTLIAGLVLLQPDAGATAMIVAVCLGILFLGGLNGRLFIVLTTAVSGVFALVIWLSPWRRERIFAYLDPFNLKYAEGSGYQLKQSLIAFGQGEWLGAGLGAGLQKMNYLPERHTDFIFAVIGEELGFIGVFIVVALFYWLVKRAFEIGRQAIALERTFAGLVAQGIALWIGLQAFINTGVATGLLPTKGLTLPFVSFGGSAMLATLVAVAVLLRVDRENRALMRGGRA